MLTRDQAEALATVAAACRPDGAPRWDQPGIVAALGRVKHAPLADVAMAMIRAACDPEAKTPACITNTSSPHWRERLTPSEPMQPPRTHEVCHLCQRHAHRCICINEKTGRPTGPTLTPPLPSQCAEDYLKTVRDQARRAKERA